MAYISVNNNEGIESALRRFKRKVMTEEIIKDLKKHAHFIPPGQKAKLKSAMARKRNKKRNRMRPMNGGNNNNFGNNNNNFGNNNNFNNNTNSAPTNTFNRD
jgi:small subunit ribosomal protein S21